MKDKCLLAFTILLGIGSYPGCPHGIIRKQNYNCIISWDGLKSLLLKCLSSLKPVAFPVTQTRMIWGGQGKIRTPARENRGLEEIETAAAALFLLTADKINK